MHLFISKLIEEKPYKVILSNKSDKTNEFNKIVITKLGCCTHRPSRATMNGSGKDGVFYGIYGTFFGGRADSVGDP